MNSFNKYEWNNFIIDIDLVGFNKNKLTVNVNYNFRTPDFMLDGIEDVEEINDDEDINDNEREARLKYLFRSHRIVVKFVD